MDYVITLVSEMRMQLLYLLGGDTSLLGKFYKAAKKMTDHLLGTVLHKRHLMFDGLVSFYLASQNTKHRGRWLRRGKAAKKQVDKWVKEGDVNSTHVASLLAAELSYVSGKHVVAIELYQKAIDIAVKNGYRQDCALAYERSALNFLEMNDEAKACSHLTKSYKAYLKWGAIAKADHMIKVYGYRIETS